MGRSGQEAERCSEGVGVRGMTLNRPAVSSIVKEGNLGVFPDDWQIAKLGEVCSVRRESVKPSDALGLPYVGLEHLVSSDPRLKRTGDPSSVRSAKNFFRKDDILYGKLRPYLDKVVVADRDGICSTDIIVLTARSDVISNHYLVYLLHTKAFLNYAISTTTGVNHPRTSWQAVSDFAFPRPSLGEQKKIARTLITVCNAKEKTESVINALKELKKSLMKHLFTYGTVSMSEVDKVRLKETEIGAMPEGWQTGRLEEHIREITYGFTASSTEKPTGVRFLRITDMTDDGVNWDSVPFCECDKTSKEKYKLEKGDVLVARIGATTGKSYLVDTCPDAVFASYLIRIKTKPTLLPEFLHLIMQTEQYWKQILENKGGRLKGGVNLPVLRNLVVPTPDLSQQALIARIVKNVDHRIAVEKTKRTAIDAVFASSLHNLMTGKLRVNNLEVPT